MKITVIEIKKFGPVSVISCAGSVTVVVPYRVCLLRVKYWGDHDEVQKALDESYLHFRDWCKSKKISTSQPPFRDGRCFGEIGLKILRDFGRKM